ncbi:MAG: hypothetical protein GY926_07525 [bacterium]|nr:hypothetical protein [bacterium]
MISRACYLAAALLAGSACAATSDDSREGIFCTEVAAFAQADLELGQVSMGRTSDLAAIKFRYAAAQLRLRVSLDTGLSSDDGSDLVAAGRALELLDEARLGDEAYSTDLHDAGQLLRSVSGRNCIIDPFDDEGFICTRLDACESSL